MLLNCSRCKLAKLADLFKKDHRKGSGRSSWCRRCDNEVHRLRRKLRTPERIEADRKRYREYNKNYYYGIDMPTYDKMLAKQNGGCAVCHKTETRIVKGTLSSLSIDHDHKTGAIRGLLCDSCNKVIGLLKDDPELFRSAATYLEKWSQVI